MRRIGVVLGVLSVSVLIGSARADEGPGWLALGESLADAADANSEAEKQSSPASAYEPWQQRRGPAHPGDLWPSFGRDVKELPATIWDDTKATVTNRWALVGFAAAAAAGIALDATGTNGQVADHFSRHGSQLNKFWDNVGDAGGNPGTHFALAGAMYFTAMARDDTKTYEISKTLINALAINGMATLALKGIVNNESPNGDDFGWPSGHTSSSFCFATVMYEEYGPWVGLPLFAFAGFVGYERIDARNHDFNDVISGALIGMAIGHAVARHHQAKILGMDVVPFVDPATGAVGLALSKQW